jgi:DNA repair protein SbcC/Rad50
MIPLRLELKNFMAYRDADAVDLSGLHVVSLVGDNGAGKSTLFDAITWAVWGQARAKRDDELVAQGESEMRVLYTFQEGDDIYQVVRTRKLGKAVKGKSPTSSGQLDFFIKDESALGWRTLSEARAAETQAKIERALNLTYDTFVNSAFLRQGHADEFTVKPPGQRKDLLAEILSLDIWQEYEARAKQRLQALEQDAQKLRAELNQAENELAMLPDLERQLGEAQSQLRDAQQALEVADREHREMERQRERAQNLRAQLAQTQTRLRAIDADLGRLDVTQKEHDSALASFQRALDQREAIETGHAALLAARTEADALNLKLQSQMDLNARKTHAENRIADARRVLESERDAQQRSRDALRAQADAAALRDRLGEIQRQLAGLTTHEARRESLARERLSASDQQGEARANNESLRREMNDIKQRMKALESVGAICSTCGRELREDDRVRLLAELKRHGTERGDQFRANETLFKQLNDRRAALDTEQTEIDRALSNAQTLHREEAALQERLEKADHAAAQLPEVEQALARTVAQIDGAAFAAEARTDLKAVESDLAALGYDAAAHKRLVERSIPELAVFATRKGELDRAELGIHNERNALARLAAQRGELQTRRDGEQAAFAAQSEETAAAEKRLTGAAAANDALKQRQTQLFDAQRKVGAANQRVQACHAQAGTAQRLRQELAQMDTQQARFEALREAYGKNGVPAMIIESVLPELEASANALLGRMTAGRMSVRFETQRLTQRGDTSETLEIRINDELGERSYEMFSGGEAFRVNFAVRIALSRLLARRAGARLRTLIIDEGFGTQDAQGREQLIDAIHAIEDDFDRIFVITHIEELRDAFPARIEVRKDDRGSSARVV